MATVEEAKTSIRTAQKRLQEVRRRIPQTTQRSLRDRGLASRQQRRKLAGAEAEISAQQETLSKQQEFVEGVETKQQELVEKAIKERETVLQRVNRERAIVDRLVRGRPLNPEDQTIAKRLLEGSPELQEAVSRASTAQALESADVISGLSQGAIEKLKRRGFITTKVVTTPPELETPKQVQSDFMKLIESAPSGQDIFKMSSAVRLPPQETILQKAGRFTNVIINPFATTGTVKLTTQISKPVVGVGFDVASRVTGVDLENIAEKKERYITLTTQAGNAKTVEDFERKQKELAKVGSSVTTDSEGNIVASVPTVRIGNRDVPITEIDTRTKAATAASIARIRVAGGVTSIVKEVIGEKPVFTTRERETTFITPTFGTIQIDPLTGKEIIKEKTKVKVGGTEITAEQIGAGAGVVSEFITFTPKIAISAAEITSKEGAGKGGITFIKKFPVESVAVLGLGVFKGVSSVTKPLFKAEFKTIQETATKVQIKKPSGINIMSKEIRELETQAGSAVQREFVGSGVAQATAPGRRVVVTTRFRKFLGVKPIYTGKPFGDTLIIVKTTKTGKIIKEIKISRAEAQAGRAKAIDILKGRGYTESQAKQILRRVSPKDIVTESKFGGTLLQTSEGVSISLKGKRTDIKVKQPSVVQLDKKFISVGVLRGGVKEVKFSSKFEELTTKAAKGKQLGETGERTFFKGKTIELDPTAQLGKRTRTFEELAVAKKVAEVKAPIVRVEKLKTADIAKETTLGKPRTPQTSVSDVVVVSPKVEKITTLDLTTGIKTVRTRPITKTETFTVIPEEFKIVSETPLGFKTGVVKAVKPAKIKKTPLSKTFLEEPKPIAQPPTVSQEAAEVIIKETTRPAATISAEQLPKAVGGGGLGTSAFAGRGLVFGDATPSGRFATKTVPTIEEVSPTFATVSTQDIKSDIILPKTFSRVMVDTQVDLEIKPRLRIDQRLDQRLDTKLVQELGVSEKFVQKPLQRLDLKLDQKLAQRLTQRLDQKLDQKLAQRLGQKLDQKLRQKVRPRTPPGKPPIAISFPPLTITQRLAARLEKEPGLFQVFVRKAGKDVRIGKAKTKEAAFEKLRKKLKKTIRASGFVKKGKEKVTPSIKFGSEFRISRKDPKRLVQKKTRRLGTSGETSSLQFFRKQKKKDKRSF